MKKPILFLLTLVLLFASPVSAQNSDFSGVGHRDDFASVLINPAGLAAGNGDGYYFISEYDPHNWASSLYSGFSRAKFMSNFTWFSWVLEKSPEVSYSRYVLSLPFSKTFFASADIQHDTKAFRLSDWGLSFMFRPFTALSLGANWRNPGDNSVVSGGVSLRPLAFSKDWEHRLTLFTDGSYQAGDSLVKNIKAGAEVELINGFKVGGHYNFEEKIWSLDLNFSLDLTRFGVQGAASSFTSLENRGVYYLGTAFKYAQTPDLAPQSVNYDTPGPIVEESEGFFFPWQSRTIGLLEVLDELDELEKNSSVRAVVFRGQNFQMGQGQWEDLYRALLRLKKAGKTLVFYQQNYNTPTYLLAAATADQIFMGPLGSIELTAPATSTVFFKGLLDEWGIRFHNFRSHPAKSAANSVSETAMTPEERVNKTLLLESMAEIWKGALEGRKEKLTSLSQEILAEGPWLDADLALEAGLVDQLLYPDEVEDWLRDNEAPLNPSRTKRVERIDPSWAPAVTEKTVAFIPVVGTIGVGGEGPAEGVVDPLLLSEQIRRAAHDGRYAAILIRVDSPGGSALGSDLIAREVALAKIQKPVIVSMGNVAASGGYYIAAPATAIVAAPGTITGSIGVITTAVSVKGLMEKLKLTSETLKTGEGGDFSNPLRDLTPAEAERWTKLTRRYYDKFIQVVADGRKMSPEAVDKAAMGQVWTGLDALERGLVDKLGGIEEAIQLVQEKIGARSVTLETLTSPFTLGEAFTRIRGSVLGEELEALVGQVRLAEMLGQGGVFFLYE